MKYKKIVEMWNECGDRPWDELSEKEKVEFAFEEGKQTGYIKIAQLAEKLSEQPNRFYK